MDAPAAAAPAQPMKGKEATWIDSVTIVLWYIDLTSFKEVGRGQAMMINKTLWAKLFM